MRIAYSLMIAVAALGLARASAASNAKFYWMPDGVSVNDVTQDGSLIVGNIDGVGGYYWRWKVDLQPTIIGGSAQSVSDAGTVIAGGGQVWTLGSGWVTIPYPVQSCGTLSIYDLSPDGTTVTGLAWSGCFAYGFRWTSAGGVELLDQVSPGLASERASTVSATNHFGGFAQTTNRAPALWNPDKTGALIGPNALGEIYGFSPDGAKWAAGLWDPGHPVIGQGIVGLAVVGETFGPNAGQYEVVGPGKLNPGMGGLFPWSGEAIDVTIEGNRVLGRDTAGLGSEGWLWSKGLGIASLPAWMNYLNATVHTWDGSWNVIPSALAIPSLLSNPVEMSANGAVIVGNTFTPDPNVTSGGWIIEVPAAPFAQTFAGCSGLNPAGSLKIVSGAPSIGASTTFAVDNPLGSQVSGLAFLSLSGNTIFPGSFCGFALPGFGMDPNTGFTGELLIKVPVIKTKPVSGAVWSQGNPAQISWPIPSDLSLLGLTFYTQGVILDFGLDLPALTEAALMFVGV